MPTNNHIRAGFAIAFTAVTLSAALGTSCATEPKPRPAALDPSNPAAAESPALALTARTPQPPATTATTTTATTTTATTIASTAPAAAAPATLYTCPMHPEVISDKPGRCPKCGMKLVKKEPPQDHQK